MLDAPDGAADHRVDDDPQLIVLQEDKSTHDA
jgi:hypothetical protein